MAAPCAKIKVPVGGMKANPGLGTGLRTTRKTAPFREGHSGNRPSASFAPIPSPAGVPFTEGRCFSALLQADRDAWKRSREVVTSPANRRPYSDGDAPENRPSTPRGKGGVWPHLGLGAGRRDLEYLIRKRLTGRAHGWFQGDTLCRMASTGGLNPRRYRLSHYNPGLPLCTMCRRIAKHHGMMLD